MYEILCRLLEEFHHRDGIASRKLHIPLRRWNSGYKLHNNDWSNEYNPLVLPGRDFRGADFSAPLDLCGL